MLHRILRLMRLRFCPWCGWDLRLRRIEIGNGTVIGCKCTRMHTCSVCAWLGLHMGREVPKEPKMVKS